MAPTAPTTRKPRRNQILRAVGAVLVVGGFGVFQMGKAADVPGIAALPTGQQTSAPSGGYRIVPVDQTKVAALMKETSANPKDTASLQSLGDINFAAGDYRNASAWEQKVLEVDPKSQVALLAIGAAQFHLGNTAEARKQWLVAAGLYPSQRKFTTT